MNRGVPRAGLLDGPRLAGRVTVPAGPPGLDPRPADRAGPGAVGSGRTMAPWAGRPGDPDPSAGPPAAGAGGPERADRLEAYRVLLSLVRWATVLIGAVLTFSGPHRSLTVVVGGVLAAHALARIVAPLSYRRRMAGGAGIVGEVGVTLVAVGLTGWWSSPYVFTLAAGVVAAGVAVGFVLAIPVATVTASVVTVGTGLASGLGAGAQVQLSIGGATEILTVALVAGYGRRIFGLAEERTVTALTHATQLDEANRLLQQLNRMARTLPVSLDLGETIRSTIDQVRALTHPDVIAVLVWDGVLEAWSAPGAEGVRLPTSLAGETLPLPVRSSLGSSTHEPAAQLVDLRSAGPGLSGQAQIGLYVPLVARGRVVGIIAVESHDADGLGATQLDYLVGVGEQAALAIDNALWFSRLRTIGAEEERNRIARDLHDRVAQSLAYLAFELDRIAELSRSQDVTAQVGALRDDVRTVVTEVRDTLYDLRTDVSEDQDFASTVEAFVERVGERSDLVVRFTQRTDRRLPVPLERELWRITQEALTNVERHAKATQVEIRWTVGRGLAEVVVVDDGRGFAASTPGRLDSYGLLGMRERADAIGATLEIVSEPGRGTTVRCRVAA